MDSTPRIFQLPEMADILDIDLAKAKNWTNGRTGLTLKPSIRESTGTGKSDLYSLEDLYLMALANEFSKAGLAAKAIGKLIEAIKSKFDSISDISWLTIWRPEAGGNFRLAEGRDRPPKAILWMALSVRELLRGVEEKLEVKDRRR
jgi:hypothetical protein